MVVALCSEILPQALAELSAADAELASLINQHGPPINLCASSGRCFPKLVKSILYQQLAGAAAASIHGRLLATCGVADAEDLTPVHVLSADQQQLRAAGLSERKLQYVTELSAHFQDGRLSEDTLRGMTDQELLACLTRVRGIGPWTVDMFAMFHLGRPDVLPVGDLGVRKGMQHLYQLKELPAPARMMELAAHWQPWRSIGSYYMWRVAEAAPRAAPGAGKGRKRSQEAQTQAAAAAAAETVSTAAAAVGSTGTAQVTDVTSAAAGNISSSRKRKSQTGVEAAAAVGADMKLDVVGPVTPPPRDKGGRVGSQVAGAAISAGAGGAAQGPTTLAGRVVTRSVTGKQQQQQQQQVAAQCVADGISSEAAAQRLL